MKHNAHPELQSLRGQLRGIHIAMGDLGFAKLAAKPPILDSSIIGDGESSEESHSHQDAVRGLRALRDAVKRDLDVLEKFLDDPACVSMPALSTNAPYLISVWNEVLHAPPPIVTIWRSFYETSQPKCIANRGSRKPSGVKVDVVADGGKRWIRVNTTKNSRLQSEFRELDSYLTDSGDELSGDESRPSLASKEFDNSILRMGRSLLEAAQSNTLPGSSGTPSVTLRLTRLDPSPPSLKEYDPRIAHTIQRLSDMGLDVELGERDDTHVIPALPAPPRRLEPTIRINLDLSILIAFVSDITHSPLPQSPAEADTRYVPSLQCREWKHKRVEACKDRHEDTDERKPQDNGINEHSRALANQTLQEMTRGLLQELRDRLVALSSPTLEGVEFWTTQEARDRCLRIVLSKIGGPNEKRRVAGLFPAPGTPSSEAENAYWDNSRYPKAFLPLVPIRVFETSVPPPEIIPPKSANGRVLSQFFTLLSRTCRDILAQESLYSEGPRSTPVSSAEANQCRSGEDGDIERAAVTKANPRLTAHTVQSLLYGAAHGWTTLTANKSSVKAILRDIRAAEGGYGRYGADDRASAVAGEGEPVVMSETAAIWVVDPRSLAEGMRSDLRG
ncbi:hypothetical protein BC628DRAFT_179219 [Trametes gibbosa]|nr:hypothetical protein BC628DRAFT_179219 [Trametes gibbosa]